MRLPGKARDQGGDVGGAQPLDLRGRAGLKPFRMRSEPNPVHVLETDAFRESAFQFPPEPETGPGHVDEGIGVGALVGFGDQQTGGAGSGTRT